MQTFAFKYEISPRALLYYCSNFLRKADIQCTVSPPPLETWKSDSNIQVAKVASTEGSSSKEYRLLESRCKDVLQTVRWEQVRVLCGPFTVPRMYRLPWPISFENTYPIISSLRELVRARRGAKMLPVLLKIFPTRSHAVVQVPCPVLVCAV